MKIKSAFTRTKLNFENLAFLQFIKIQKYRTGFLRTLLIPIPNIISAATIRVKPILVSYLSSQTLQRGYSDFIGLDYLCMRHRSLLH